MTINWDLNLLISEISKISYAESDPNATGFETWRCKQDLYRILWHIEEKLNQCSNYTGEEEFLKDRQREITWKVLTNETKIRN